MTNPRRPFYAVAVAEGVEGKRVTWAEGFFDLVIVLAVTQVASLLGEHHQWWGLGRAFIILALVYRTWVIASLQSNRLGSDSTWDRTTLFGVGLCGLVMAIFIPHVYDSGGLQFALAFWVARFFTWGRYVVHYQTKFLSSLGLGVFVVGPLVVLGGLLPDNSREMVWFLAALVDLALVAFFGRQHALIHYDHSHLMERYGLFVLIALGESIVDLSLPLARQASAIEADELLAVAVCFVVVCLLWWTYFDHANAAITQALSGVREHVDDLSAVGDVQGVPGGADAGGRGGPGLPLCLAAPTGDRGDGRLGWSAVDLGRRGATMADLRVLGQRRPARAVRELTRPSSR